MMNWQRESPQGNKKEIGSDVAGAQELAKLNAEHMFAELTKWQDGSYKCCCHRAARAALVVSMKDDYGGVLS